MACSSHKENPIKIETFPVTSPVILDTSYIKEYVADLHAVKNVEIRARVYGEIKKIHIDEGQAVKQGQLLFSIEDYSYREELSKANSNLKNAVAEAKSAELDLVNAKTLLEKNIVSSTEVARAEAKLEALNAKIEEARSLVSNASLKLSFTQIKAPFDGLIDRIPLKMGSLVNEGTLLTTISDNNEVFAYFNVSENEYLNFVTHAKQQAEKREVSLLLANSAEHPYKGKIETIEGEFDKATGNISFRARFPNPDKILKHGASGKVLLKTNLNKVMIIPQKSTFDIQDKTFVFLVDQNNEVKLQNIKTKLRLPHLFVLESGLSPKDRIVYEGLQRVREGDKIIPEPTSIDLYSANSINN
ncbi:HlyD family multidrug resistance protein [Sporocytophaga myxococcoides]|uniref:HlyD family multidrug resistance protein n=2 Tax=Sporocytophaga myxococcoides TaxID=153721 RepID=A0A098L8M9_9BACT|nr:HlyD family multidrug resistance protein [Sporocytophaga myxococcoides]